MITKKTNNKGFTLIELLLSLAILSVIMLPLTMTVTTGYRAFFTQEENIEVMQNGRFALDKITEKIRQANPDDIEIVDNTLKIGNYSYYKQGNSLMEKINNTSNEVARYIKTLSVEGRTLEGQLRSIDITIVLHDKRIDDYKLETTVFIRNR